jgi:hypothetical protein
VTTRAAGFQGQYEAVFGHAWPVWGGALLVGTLNAFLFAFDRPWTASDGARNWGDWVLRGAGLIERPDLVAPWLYSGSVLNLGVLLGASAAALLSREFAVRVPVGPELAKGALGGLLMGCGAVLAFGCNVGGFFSALSALSGSGFGMMVGLGAGTVLGLRYLLWEMEHRPDWSAGRAVVFGATRSAGEGRSGLQPLLGVLLLAGLVVASLVYTRLGYVPQAVYTLFGVAFGVVFQRSRFCLVRAFREPFVTGEADHTRAAALALVVSLVGFSILKAVDLKDPRDWVFPGFWVGGLLGGLVFGVGMLLAGGCGAGAIWRAGEGHVKLWGTVACFALGASLTRLVLGQFGWLGKLGVPFFLPSVLGWGGAVSLVVLVAGAWYAFATWNEASGRFSMLGG